MSEKKKAAVFCSKGIGDGLIFLTLSHNLLNSGYEVETFHDTLGELQQWVPHLLIKKYPSKQDIFSLMPTFDLIIINGDDSPISKSVKKLAIQKFFCKTWIFEPSSRSKVDPLSLIDPQKTIVSNLICFCQKNLNLQNIERKNGFSYPKHLIHKKHPLRIVIHPTSASPRRNWPDYKFLRLAKIIQQKGYEVIFITAAAERKKWKWIEKENFQLPYFSSLTEMASFIYESGAFIGNDSGIGHLANALNIPSVIIFSSLRKKRLWQPDWIESKGVIPISFLPNIKGARLREKYWTQFIGVKRVLKIFFSLNLSENAI